MSTIRSRSCKRARRITAERAATEWPPGTFTVDRLEGGTFFLTGAFDDDSLTHARVGFPGWVIRLESTRTMMLIAPGTAAGLSPSADSERE